MSTDVAVERVAVTDMPGTDSLMLRPVLGDGILARQADLVLLCESGRRGAPRAAALLDTLSSVAAAGGDGADLCRRLAHLLTADGYDGAPSLCAFGPAAGGLAVLVHGRAAASLVGPDGAIRLDGRDAVTCIDRLVPHEVTLVSAELGDEPRDLMPDPWARLQAGVVRASAVVADHKPARTDDQVRAPIPESAPVTPAAPPQETPPPATLPPATSPPVELPSAAVADGAHPDGCDCDVCQAPDGSRTILGITCGNGHFNDPRVPYCTNCGMSMVNVPREPHVGVRPPLGVLVLDDGSTYPLDQGYVLGRRPELADVVSTGEHRALRMGDAEDSISRVHARVDIDGWDVLLTDTESTNGTYVWSESDRRWQPVHPNQPVPIMPGTWVRVGRRSLRYTSHRGV
jgi:hypothetical protein